MENQVLVLLFTSWIPECLTLQGGVSPHFFWLFTCTISNTDWSRKKQKNYKYIFCYKHPGHPPVFVLVAESKKPFKIRKQEITLWRERARRRRPNSRKKKNPRRHLVSSRQPTSPHEKEATVLQLENSNFFSAMCPANTSSPSLVSIVSKLVANW